MSGARKVIIAGSFGVGKTSLIRRHVHGTFSPVYQATIGVNLYRCTEVIEGTAFELVIWDVEGLSEPDQRVDRYWIGASAALIVGDATRSETITSMALHAQSFLHQLPGRPIGFAINKADLRPVPDRAEAELAERFSIEPLRTSALNGHNVRQAFSSLARLIWQRGL